MVPSETDSATLKIKVASFTKRRNNLYPYGERKHHNLSKIRRENLKTGTDTEDMNGTAGKRAQ
jgi:hypothetical protein